MSFAGYIFMDTDLSQIREKGNFFDRCTFLVNGPLDYANENMYSIRQDIPPAASRDRILVPRRGNYSRNK